MGLEHPKQFISCLQVFLTVGLRLLVPRQYEQPRWFCWHQGRLWRWLAWWFGWRAGLRVRLKKQVFRRFEPRKRIQQKTGKREEHIKHITIHFRSCFS